MNTPVKNKQELIERLLANREKLLSFGITRLGIFGSFARDTATAGSDVDFFVEMPVKYKTLENFSDLYEFLELITGRKIEIVTPQSLNKFIGKYIVQEVEYVPIAA
ncbi:MAG: nucleotidyltransferase domain-containing protein [Bacteroidota bacterium]